MLLPDPWEKRMAHLLPEAIRQGMRGPSGLVGAIVGGVIVVTRTGLTAGAPSNCGAVDIHPATEGIAFFCSNVPTGQIVDPHTISWLGVFVGAILGGALGAWLGRENEE